jgi:RNA polymerase sigma factor (sigma-70 family)
MSMPGATGALRRIANVALSISGRRSHDDRQVPAYRHRVAIAVRTPSAVTASGGPGSPVSETNPVAMFRSPGPDAGTAVVTLYRMHYRSLVGLAALLVPDTDVAEALVQDSFVAMHSCWRRLAGGDRALSYLHRAVVTRSRSALRHRTAAGTTLPALAPDSPGPRPAPITEPDYSAVILALWALAPHEREVLVLMYYAGLSEAQIVSAMRIRKGALKSHAEQAMTALLAELRRINGR